MKTGAPQSSLATLVELAALPASAAASVEIVGSDPVWPTRYKVVAPGAAAIAATGLAAALRGSRYLRINGERPALNARCCHAASSCLRWFAALS